MVEFFSKGERLADFVTVIGEVIRQKEYELTLTHRSDLALEIKAEIATLKSHMVNLPQVIDPRFLDANMGPELLRFLIDLRPGDEIRFAVESRLK